MEDKENLTADTDFELPNHGKWVENGLIILNKYKIYSELP
jgi:hypothetical protein